MQTGEKKAFLLDPRLEADTLFVRDLSLCRMLLMDNALFPWLILVPRQEGLIELCDLPARYRPMLWEEICEVSDALKRLTGARKINIGALGNIVSQLHIHIVARNEGDAAWPGPVWGGPRAAYEAEGRAAMLERLHAAF